MASKEGINRAERQGKDDKGGYTPENIPGSAAVNNAAGAVVDGGKAAGGVVGGLFGSGKKE
jgi:hypothetical protein